MQSFKRYFYTNFTNFNHFSFYCKPVLTFDGQNGNLPRPPPRTFSIKIRKQTNCLVNVFSWKCYICISLKYLNNRLWIITVWNSDQRIGKGRRLALSFLGDDDYSSNHRFTSKSWAFITGVRSFLRTNTFLFNKNCEICVRAICMTTRNYKKIKWKTTFCV